MKHFFFGCVVLFFAIDSTAAYKVPVEPLQQFDVADYGAVSGDGLQDHTAINAAIDAACAVGGGVINLEPAAIYEFGSGTAAYLGAQVDCDNITISTPAGQPPAVFRSLATGTGAHYTIVVGQGQNANGLVPPSASSQLHNIRISNIEFEDTTIPSSAQHGGAYIVWVDNIRLDTIRCTGLGGKCLHTGGVANKPIENIVISDVIATQTPSYTGATEQSVIHLQSVQNAVVEKFQCTDGLRVANKHCLRTSTNATTPTDNLRISDSTFGDGFERHLYIGGGQNVFVTRCKFSNAWGLATAAIELKTGATIRNLYIYGNMFFGETAFLRASGANELHTILIANNIIDGTITSDTEAGTSTTSTMESTGAGWTVDEFIGKWIECTSGSCSGESYAITDNDEDTITIGTTWAGGTPDGVTFRIVGERALDITHSSNELGLIVQTNIVSNFFATPFQIAAGTVDIKDNSASNIGMDASACFIKSLTTANNTGYWSITGNTVRCNDAATGVIAANWSSATQLSVNDNMISGTALGTAIDAYATIMRGNDINCCVTGIVPRQSASLVSNNRIVTATDAISINDSVSATAVVGNVTTSVINVNDTANYTVMIGNIPYGSTAQCSTVNGGVGANDLCIANIGMKDVLSPTGVFAPNDATLPATCTLGEIYVDNDATAGDQMHVCTATDTWTAQ